MRDWTETLLHHPLAQFYASADAPDHLPGDLWFLWAVGRLFEAFGGRDLNGTGFTIVSRSSAAVADLIIAMMLYVIVARWHGAQCATMALLFYLFNPVSIFLTSIWGQWDAVSMAFVLIAIWFFLQRGEQWLWGIPFLAWALMIKPPLALFVPILLLVPLRQALADNESLREAIARLAPRVVLAAALAIATVCAIGLPFRVGLPGVPTRWSLIDRLNYALDMWPFTTMGAANIWMTPILSLERRSDTESLLLGLSAHAWGNILLALVYGYILLTVWRFWSTEDPEPMLFWGLLASSLAFFLLPTRVHERYLFAAIVLSILVAASSGGDRRWLAFAAALSTSSFINIASVYWHGYAGIYLALSLANGALLALALLAPYRWQRLGGWAGGPSRPHSASSRRAMTHPG